ncbi:MAG: hypothetical protein KBT88_07680 [Gammaproteobacteria bacterium]|nr:hypothetical protein [Gammaproteobacteria bacterium]MBQ0839652.1 hypothetical protein [Gammaproteobacteria bacterium]
MIKPVIASLIWVWAACGVSTVLAHGGVSIEDDVCLIKIDRYKAHFTGYLPQERATQEFCEDIPIATESIFVIDYISDELREMELDFRIIRDVNEIGVLATLADLGGEKAIEDATVYYAEPKLYHKGVMNIRHKFTQDGGYIGIVHANHLETGLKYTSVFPFTVGQVSYSEYVKYYLVLFFACGIFIYAGGRGHVFKVRPPKSPKH